MAKAYQNQIIGLINMIQHLKIETSRFIYKYGTRG